MVGYCHIQPYVAMVRCFAKQGEVIKKDGGADTKEGWGGSISKNTFLFIFCTSIETLQNNTISQITKTYNRK